MFYILEGAIQQKTLEFQPSRMPFIRITFAALLLGLQLALVRGEFFATPVTPQFSNYVAVTWLEDGEALAAGYQVSGGAVIRSLDHGTTWTQIGSDSVFATGLYGIAARRLSDGVARYITVDADGGVYGYDGSSWSNLAFVPTALVGVTIGSNGNSFVAGALGIIYSSSNSSSYTSWGDVSPPAAAGTFFYDISTVDGSNVIAVGASGSIYYTTDAGSSWQAASSGTTVTIYCISRADSSFAMVAGENGYIAKSRYLYCLAFFLSLSLSHTHILSRSFFLSLFSVMEA